MDNFRIKEKQRNRQPIASILVMFKVAIIDGRQPVDWDNETDTDLLTYIAERYTVTPKEINDHLGI